MIGILKESKKLSIQENLSPNIGSSSYGKDESMSQTRSADQIMRYMCIKSIGDSARHGRPRAENAHFIE